MNTDILTNPRKFVPEWFRSNGLVVKSNLLIGSNGKHHEISTVKGAMWLDSRELIMDFNVSRDKKIKGFNQKDLDTAFDEFILTERIKAFEDLKNDVACTDECFEELQKFLIACTGKCDDTELSVIAHCLWQTKRKLTNRKVKDHMMLILKGKQGAGKTEAVKKLYEPIKPWFKGASLKDITDDRWKFFFKQNLVVFCDELQHAELACVDALKNLITAEYLDGRRLSTNNYETIPQNCSFVGATNRSVCELIRDNTGMRRFFEIETLDVMDWNTLNDIDSIKIWMGIDEKRDSTYIAPHANEIKRRQSQLIIESCEQRFLEEFDLNKKHTGNAFITSDDLYKAYVLFTQLNGEKAHSKNTFIRKIKENGFNYSDHRNGSKGTRGYLIPLEALMLLKPQYKTGSDLAA